MVKTAVTILLFNLIVFAICLAVAEIGVRYYYPHFDLLGSTGVEPVNRVRKNRRAWDIRSPYSRKAYRPNTRIKGKGNPVKKVNSHGFVSTPEITYEKTEGTLRIAFLGGSSTAGTGKLLKRRRIANGSDS